MAKKEDEKPFIRLSVHGLVDFLLRSGDIDDRVYNQDTMEEGTRLHSSYQKKQGDDYLFEVFLQETIETKEGTIVLQGRADGIIDIPGKPPIIDELKSTVMGLEEFFEQQKEWHLGQALCYAFMYLHQEKKDKCIVRLTYLSQESNDKLIKEFPFALKEVEKRVYKYIKEYFELESIVYEHRKKRDESVVNLPFPYGDFRPGQRELAKYSYGTAIKGGVFFAEAPTGIGKTMSTLYPFVKSFKEGRNEKLFYLTAKTLGGIAAYDALTEMYGKGLVANDSFLHSRDKICFLPGHACNPDDCPFTKNYYGKLKEAMLEVAKSGKRFSRETIIETCMEKTMCPFEFQLDLSLWADIVICDYNYFFDPLVHLERYFDESVDTSRDIVLIDEAHNLVERGRSMFSAELSTELCFYAKKALGKSKEALSLKKGIGKLENAILSCLKIDEKEQVYQKVPEELEKAIESLINANIRHKKKGKMTLPSETKELMRETYRFKTLYENYFKGNSKLYCYEEGKEVHFKLLCLDASPFLRQQLSRVRSAILFSATLSPIRYFMQSILGRDDYPYLLLPSPFPKENFKLLLAPKVSVRYKDRESTYVEVAKYLEEFVKAKKGNYFIYFPSYEYLRNIRSLIDIKDASIFVQDRSMNALEKEEFLANFPPSPEGTNVGLMILGGSFSEGIDMVDDRLIGVAIVGIGLPGIGTENNLIRDYYSGKGEDGFEVAYKNPGMNKVMQAVGRLIRSPSDVGAALLLDDRYMKEEYRRLFERLWSEYEVIMEPKEIRESLKAFYKDK